MKYLILILIVAILAVRTASAAEISSTNRFMPSQANTNGTNVVVGSFNWQDKTVTLILTHADLVYTILQRDTGTVLAERLTQKELRDRFPEIHREIIRRLCG